MPTKTLETAKPNPIPFRKNDVIDFLYGIENPTYKNVNQDKGYVWMYNDGTPTIAAGLAKTSGIHPEWFNGQLVRKSDADNAAYNHFVEGDAAIRKEYDRQYGTTKYPHPSDTLSVGPRMYAAQAKYQKGFLGEHTNPVIKALASGNSKNIVKAISNATPSWDVDRMRRVLATMPAIYSGKVIPSKNKKK